MKFVVIALIVAFIAFYLFRSVSNNKIAAKNIELGSHYLSQNKTNDAVTETASGLQFMVLQEGDGQEHPKATTTVKVHYHGTLIDGTVFDSSVDRNEAVSFPLNRVIKGWTEGLQLMVVGDKYRFFIPPELAYGNSAAGIITPGSTLIFDVELLAIE